MVYILPADELPSQLSYPGQLEGLSVYFSRADAGDELIDRLREFQEQLHDGGAAELFGRQFGEQWSHYNEDVLRRDGEDHMFEFDPESGDALHDVLEQAIIHAVDSALADPQSVKGLQFLWNIDASATTIGFATVVGPDTVVLTLRTPVPVGQDPPRPPSEPGETIGGVTFHEWDLPGAESAD